ncbi:hypothetical protein [Nocardioides hwasunensis]|uniref:Uncharacterized protein n=1 Tax=Nocardioides hwasunensis TaxID=397258 RepID=A0ABR8MNI3_9ACTN|nr:hypothetical protein [Nocardioides hwasunensis]MBD3916094.1 hypothetical protein [Nocardioides hwasunensis]
MLNTLTILAAEAEAEGSATPYLVGGGMLILLLVLLMAVVSFGGGREHS